MPRYRLTLEYDGSGFAGWQRQKDVRSVQQTFEEAVQAISGGLTVDTIVAGRTDAGVHARGQVVHFDLDRDFTPDRIRDGLNFYLRENRIAVLDAAIVDADFSARLSATRRHYLYRILNRRPPPAIEAGSVWHVPVPLDAEAMHAAAQRLLGHHDFNSFRSTECQAKSSLRTLDALRVMRADDEIHVTTSSRSFLHNQVRILTGTLKLVGEGRWTADDVSAALAKADRRAAGPTAPPEGLCLMQVDY
ncbi:MAG: tRNA pseudouridine(38-40) synthase TruA [Ferrovibrio sp.]|uniref:tRNA pseudouridine(38-40) synthase TruA n=1 Tax=Ferrovibrio sp. TaxID=1917215 RepID=UPI002615F333|nr:tRNA pseudouridine(38-40) synthase TruA [Ferrovibrio sp.]MCW0233640.1 tRNA pseudouridine(38-40) synthase TruA [Ferrovibrio sp.]